MWPSSGFKVFDINFELYSFMFLAIAFFNNSYLLSISLHKEFNVLITLSLLIIIAFSESGSFAR